MSNEEISAILEIHLKIHYNNKMDNFKEFIWMGDDFNEAILKNLNYLKLFFFKFVIYYF